MGGCNKYMEMLFGLKGKAMEGGVRISVECMGMWTDEVLLGFSGWKFKSEMNSMEAMIIGRDNMMEIYINKSFFHVVGLGFSSLSSVELDDIILWQ